MQIYVGLSLGFHCPVKAWDAEEEATPKLFDFNTGHPAGRAVVNREEFFQQFNVSRVYDLRKTTPACPAEASAFTSIIRGTLTISLDQTKQSKQQNSSR